MGLVATAIDVSMRAPAQCEAFSSATFRMKMDLRAGGDAL